MKIIEVDHLTKEYRLGQIFSLKDLFLNTFRRLRGLSTYKRATFKAIDDISFSVDYGEVIGIIGSNGAGKSTLLKHLAGITTATSGSIKVRGKVAPLIEVGAGLNPELTGRENIFLNASILGIPKQKIKEKLPGIVEFAELEKFIDTPVKRYSSGMTVRLGFSIATSIEADILIVDEVLAVGDLAFQRKCFDRMEQLIKKEGKTVLLVSHNIRQVERLCTRVILLDQGRISTDGETSEVCNLFYEKSADNVRETLNNHLASTRVKGTGEVDVVSVEILGKEKVITDNIRSGESLTFRVVLAVKQSLKKPEIVVGTHTTDFIYLTANSTAVFPNRPNLPQGQHIVECTIPSFPMAPGAYCVRVTIFDQHRRLIYDGETLKVFGVLPRGNEMLEAALRLFDLDAHWNIGSHKLAPSHDNCDDSHQNSFPKNDSLTE